MEVIFVGRIEQTEFKDNVHHVELAVAAEDLYSKPSSFRVRSNSALGNVGEVVKAAVKISGFVKRSTYIDKKTGEVKPSVFGNVFFDVNKFENVKN